MRKGNAEVKSGTIPFDAEILKDLKSKGYQFVQVKGLTADNHYEYTEPGYLLVVPMKELPPDQIHKDIYESIDSEIIDKLANEKNETLPGVITNQLFK